MRMQKCPHCGAENSVKRDKCYQCQQPLTPVADEGAPTRQAQGRPPEADSRWQALELPRDREGRGAPPSAPEQVPTTGPPSVAQADNLRYPPQQRSYMPLIRHPLGHVRRMGLFFRQLHSLTQAGFPVAGACREMESRAPWNLRGLVREMREAAEAGKPVSEAMGRHRDLFYAWHIGLVGAAEAGGFLPDAFDQIAHGYEVEWETRSALLFRLAFYGLFGVPAVLLTIPIIVFLTLPIPKDGWTPTTVWQTWLLYLRTVSLPIALGLVALVVVSQILASTSWFQGVQQRVVAVLPVFGRLARTAALERYLSALGLLLRAGLPVGNAAEQAAAAAGNAVITPRLLTVVPALREGTPLSQALAATRVLDRDTLNMAATGETSGTLPDMLTRMGNFYRDENETRRKLVLRMTGIAIGLVWIFGVAAIGYIGLKAYFDYAFRVYDWMQE
jgi:type IV pilus assembly protein PilC